MLNPIAQYRQEIPWKRSSSRRSWPTPSTSSAPVRPPMGPPPPSWSGPRMPERFNKDYVLVKAQELIVNTRMGPSFFTPRYISHPSLPPGSPPTGLCHGRDQRPGAGDRSCRGHDCFSPVELIGYEDLGFCEKGEGEYFIEEGRSSRDGDLPVNASGGLESCGHPVGATGVRMINEITRHLQGKAGRTSGQKCQAGSCPQHRRTLRHYLVDHSGSSVRLK